MYVCVKRLSLNCKSLANERAAPYTAVSKCVLDGKCMCAELCRHWGPSATFGGGQPGLSLAIPRPGVNKWSNNLASVEYSNRCCELRKGTPALMSITPQHELLCSLCGEHHTTSFGPQNHVTTDTLRTARTLSQHTQHNVQVHRSTRKHMPTPTHP